MSRVQVSDLSAPERVRPAAAPVNRFARATPPPVTVGPNRSQQLAQALSNIQPSLTRFLSNRQNRTDQTEVLEARRMRLKTALTFKDAVASGKIAPDQNPFYVQEWLEQDGRVSADQYNAALQVALETGEFSQSVNPSETEGLIADFRRRFIEANGLSEKEPAFLSGFANRANVYETDATRAQAARISNRIDQQRRENTFFEIQGIMDELDSRNLSMEGAADGINLTKDHQLLVGVQPQEFNDIVLDAVAAKALDLKDPGVFKVLDSIATGTGVLGRTSKARDTVARITSRIASDLEDKDRFDAEQEDRLREEAARTASSTIQSVLFENNLNGKETTLEQVAEAMRDLALADPRLAQSMRQAIITSALPGKEDDPQMRQDLYLGLFENGRIDRVQVAGAFNAGTITLATSKDLFDRDARNTRNTESDRRARQAEARANEPAGITADPVFKQGKSNLEAIFAQDPLKNIDQDLSFRKGEALLQYHFAADEFRTANPNATLQEKLKFTSDIVGALSDGFSSNLSGKTSQQVIDASPGVQSGDITPISELGKSPSASQEIGLMQFFKEEAEFFTALDEYSAALPNASGTRLGDIIRQLKLKPEEILDFLNAQGNLYQ